MGIVWKKQGIRREMRVQVSRQGRNREKVGCKRGLVVCRDKEDAEDTQ